MAKKKANFEIKKFRGGGRGGVLEMVYIKLNLKGILFNHKASSIASVLRIFCYICKSRHRERAHNYDN